MSRLGKVPAASRYESVTTGPRLSTSYEIQEGIPVDGSNELLRELSPFTIRMVPPDVLLAAAASLENGVNLASSAIGSDPQASALQARQARSVSLLQKAATENNFAEISATLGRVTLLGTTQKQLEYTVSEGKFRSSQDPATYSTIVNSVVAADIALQLQNLLKIPPLTLLINPNTFTLSFTKIQSYTTRTRKGLVFESWGEEQPRISISGSTGAFMAGSTPTPRTAPQTSQVTLQTSSVSGVQFASKRDSAAWQNFMSLYTFYRNNGYIYDVLGASEGHHFIGALAIDYDQWTYVGHMESFSYTYDETSPHKVAFDIEFTVSRMYDWAAPSSVEPLSAVKGVGVSSLGVASRTNSLSNGLRDVGVPQLGDDDVERR